MKRSVTIGFLLMLFTTGAYAQEFKVRENRMWITLPANIPESTAVQFVWKFNLHDIGIYQLLRTGKYDSLKSQGWSVTTEEKKYILSKALGKPNPSSYPVGKAIFTPVPTPDNWREVGGNRTTWGYNRFYNGREFLIENKIVHFELKGYSDAKNVRLAGNFTNWQHAAFPMTRTLDGWKVQVKLEPGQYYYKFIIDGHWITDPVNKLTENDGRGNMNSVFFVPNEKFRLNNHANASNVYVTGSFSNWNAEAVPMKKVGDSWEAQLYIEEGTYQYHFLVDGKKIKSDNNGEKWLTLGKPYTFKLKGFTNARTVILAGNFNFWNKEDLQMKKTADGWELPYVLGPGNYQYKFIVDGRWITDPSNKTIVRDEHGNDNSFFVFGENYTFWLSGYTNAKEVRITGDFTEYSPTGILMEKMNNGWQGRVFLAKGKHRYRYIIDGQSMKDPANNAWEYTRNKDKISILWIDPNDPH